MTMYSALQRPVIYGKARLWRGPRKLHVCGEPVKLPLHASYPLGGHRAEMQQRYAEVELPVVLVRVLVRHRNQYYLMPSYKKAIGLAVQVAWDCEAA